MFLLIEHLEMLGLTRRIDKWHISELIHQKQGKFIRNTFVQPVRLNLLNKTLLFKEALESGESTVGIVSTKQALRDATDLGDITIDTVGVTSVTTQLKASWDASLLGDNPW